RLDPDAQPDELATPQSAQLELLLLAAALTHGQETLGAALDPADRPCQPLGEGGHDRLLGIDRQLRAEATTDISCDADHLVFSQAHPAPSPSSDLQPP